MIKDLNNYAFIDTQNVHLSTKQYGLNMDWHKFRIYLQEKYHVKKAYIFLGYKKEYQYIYTNFEKNGYELIFKEILEYKDGVTKGNIDAELVLQTMINFNGYDQAVIIRGDGDFSCLIKYLKQQNKLGRLLIPNKYRYSGLLKKVGIDYIDFMNHLKSKIEK